MPDESTLERLTQFAQTMSGRMRVHSALNPMLWLCGLVSPISIGCAMRLTDGAQADLLVIASIPILCACAGFFYFMIKAPNRLQSEDYQIRQQALELIQEKGSKIALVATTVQAIANPMAKQLTDGSDK